ncbi:MAG: hypothetical protein JNJ50_22740 [Acidobacteria bacterium]|nr:hypothetical protein [Acidobacteriota bacterium]
MTTKGRLIQIAKLMSLGLVLTLSAALTADAKGNSGSRNEQGKRLLCRVQAGASKVVTITNETEQTIFAGTSVSFSVETGVNGTTRLRSDLKPGRTVVVHIGNFDGFSCNSALVQR